MANKECVRDLIERGYTPQEATEICGRLLGSKVTPGIRLRRVVPGERTTPGRAAFESLLLKKRRIRRKRRFRGIPRG